MTNTIESFEQNCQKVLKQNLFYNNIYISVLAFVTFVYGLITITLIYYYYPILTFNNIVNAVLSIIAITALLSGFVIIAVSYFLLKELKELTQQNVYFDEGKKQKQLNIIDFNNALKNSNVKKYKIYNKDSNKYIIMVEKDNELYWTDSN